MTPYARRDATIHHPPKVSVRTHLLYFHLALIRAVKGPANTHAHTETHTTEQTTGPPARSTRGAMAERPHSGRRAKDMRETAPPATKSQEMQTAMRALHGPLTRSQFRISALKPMRKPPGLPLMFPPKVPHFTPFPPLSPLFPPLGGPLVTPIPQSTSQKWHFWAFRTERSPFSHKNQKKISMPQIFPVFPKVAHF